MSYTTVKVITKTINVGSPIGLSATSLGTLEPDKKYTLQFKAIIHDNTQTFDYIYVGNNKLPSVSVSSGKLIETIEGKQLKLFSTSFTPSQRLVNPMVQVGRMMQSSDKASSLLFELTDFQLELGDISTYEPNRNDLTTVKNVLESKINQLSDQLQFMATKNDYDALGNQISSALGQIDVKAGEIELKVSQDEIISKINLTPEKIKINTNLLDLSGNLDLQGRFKCWKSNSDKTGNYLNLEGAMLFGYNKTGGQHPVFASGLWTDENMGYFSVGYTRADVSDANGCLYISPQQNNAGGRLTFSRLVGSDVKSANLYFQKDGSIDFISNLHGQKDNLNIYTYRFDGGTSVKHFFCHELTCRGILPNYTGTYDIGSASYRFKDGFMDSVSTTNQNFLIGTIASTGGWQQYGALGINSTTGYVFPVKYSGALSLGTGNNRFHILNSVNPVNVSSDRRDKVDIHYLDEEKQVLNIVEGEHPRVEQNMNLTTKDMYDFIKDELRLASYRYKINLDKGITDVDYNFIAQDILFTKVGSEIIKLEDKNDLDSALSYNQGNLISTVIGALQEEISLRDKQIVELNERLVRLEEKLM